VGIDTDEGSTCSHKLLIDQLKQVSTQPKLLHHKVKNKQYINMTKIRQISYTCPKKDEAALPRTFVVNVDADVHAALERGGPSDVFVSDKQCEVLALSPDDGTLFPADPQELKSVFGTDDIVEVATTIIREGQLEGTYQKPEEMKNEVFA
jgi:hypothetical protein